jgi:hypothetical protein
VSDKGNGLSGPRTRFSPKDPRPVSLSLTTTAVRILANAAKRTGASRSDVVEQLLRQYGSTMEFTEGR